MTQLALKAGSFTTSVSLIELMSKIYGQDQDMVLLSGSLMEGLGNCYSDLDVLVFCESLPDVQRFNKDIHNEGRFRYNGWLFDPTSKTWSTHEYLDEEGIQIEISYIAKESLVKSIASIDKIFSHVTSRSFLLKRPFEFSKSLSFNEKETVHRVLRGTCIRNHQEYYEFKDSIDSAKFCFICYRDSRINYSLFKDCLGPLKNQDYHSSCYLLKRLLIDHMRSFLHLNQETNTKPKWVFQLAQKLPDCYQNLSQMFLEIIQENGIQALEMFISKVCLFVDQIFAASLSLLEKHYGNLRYDLYEILIESYGAKDLSHPQIARALAFEERFYSRHHVPLDYFFQDNIEIKPTLCFA
ncbi:MAG TPA: hypothetical protein VNJ29_01360 [Candidatus Nitrosotenuis sp.]|jgi:hypothetical protein|nr:hypothetical protein [Candidatus Nitrosotenuis sp.]